MKVLVSGAGIAGLTLAWWLRRGGHDVLVVDKAPALRDAGYMIDFFGPGFAVAERMGMLDELAAIHAPVARLVFHRPDGREKFALPYHELRRKLFGDRHFNFTRGDLERLLYAHVPPEVELRFGTSIATLAQDASTVHATLSDGSAAEVDLVVGADGVHSRVRELVFGHEEQFTRYLGYHAAAFVADDAELARDIGGALHTLTVPGRQVTLGAMPGGCILAFFAHRNPEPRVPPSREAARRELRAIYGDLGWRVRAILAHLDDAPSVYFDTVSQIVMPQWTARRIALVGDACWCVTLLAGQGASLAMAGAYTLADELGRADVRRAVERYEQRLRPIVERRQRAGRAMGRWFVPESATALALRDFATRLAGWPGISHLVRRRIASESALPAGDPRPAAP